MSLAIKEKKYLYLKKISDIVENSKISYFISCKEGIDADIDYAIRSRFYDIGAKFIIVKNTLTNHALKNSKSGDLYKECQESAVFTGRNAIIFSNNDIDPIRLVKVIVECNKEFKNFGVEFKFGILENKYLSVEDIKLFISLPSAEYIYFDLVSAIMSPVVAIKRYLQFSSSELHRCIKHVATDGN